MKLLRLSLLNYKNIEEAELEFSSKINCFIGKNGEGKTNLLDSIHFLSFTKSAISIVDSHNIRHGQPFMMAKGIYEINGENEEISTSIQPPKKKSFRRNEKEYKRLSEHIGIIPLIMVSPSDSELILGGSENRRRFMDMVISQYNLIYMASLNRYNKALQQRNALLKQENMPIDDMLTVYEEIMADSGEYIYKERVDFIDKFIPIFQKFYSAISGENEKVTLTYTSHCQRGPLLEIIQRDRMKDKVVGYSLHGIHKDDLDMCINTHPIKREGSQGQNKTFLVALKLAQFEFLKTLNTQKPPILLLDDIFDKLDAVRVGNIVNIVSRENFGQIFITDTNRENLDRILEKSGGDYKIFKVENGKFEEEKLSSPN